MEIDARQYLTDIGIDEIHERNVVVCKDEEERTTLLIRNSLNSKDYATFQNEYLLLKNSVNLLVENKNIGNFHILICKKTDDISVAHFCRVCDYLFVKNNKSMSSEEMVKLFYSLERIFSEIVIKNTDLEIGLYGELAVINYLFNINSKMYDKWHADFFSKHDFELNKRVKLEVKTTRKTNRIHSFSHDQVYRTNLKVYIISSIIQPCEKGTSLYELCKQTIEILTDKTQMLAIELLIKKLGLSEEYQGVNCILEDVYSKLKLYNAEDVPHLQGVIPEGVSNIHYDIDLSNVRDIQFQELDNLE